METLPLWVLIIGALMNLIALPLAAKRVWWLWRLISSGQPEPGRIEGVTKRVGQAIKNQAVEVFGQKKLLKWSVPGIAHAFVMYAFLILGTVYVEAYGILISADPAWSFLVLNSWGPLGFLQDLIGVLCVVGLALFAWIRLKNAPEKLGRRSRFKGSHLGGAWLVLFMIFNVIWTMFAFRGAASALDNLGYGQGAFVSYGLGQAMSGLSEDALHVVEGVGLLLHIGVMLVFLIIVLNSKHLHIFIAPINVAFKREPVALGAAKPMYADGKALTLDDVEELDEDTQLGIGSIEDFSWKGLLDMATCTECGRCQDQCPAWTTDKPLSPKMLIMNLRDHAFETAPYLITEGEPSNLSEAARKAHERPLVGATEGEAWHPTGGGVIDPDVLWSCVTCGACVQQCPVDIEHVDHIIDMRRHQVLVESNFPAELNGLFKGMESKGNPWNMSPKARLEWAQGLEFDVPVVGEDVEDLDSVDWLFWVGCAGAYEDRAKKTTRAVAELLHMADVKFAVLGNGETCTGDSARRAGNEFLFQQLAMENVETFKETKAKKVVSTCAHCFNTLKNEYKQFGLELEVVHHTQLLNRLVREKRLTPVAAQGGGRSITYHDPCYLGRHNQVYSPPRELLQVIPNAEFKEMPRNSERSFCCGAGGARMWMEENIGTRINENRTNEAVDTGADQIAVGCPFCRVMLDDGLTNAQSQGRAREEVEVLDVAQLLLASVKGEQAGKAASAKSGGDKAPSAKAGAAAAASAGTATATLEREETPAESTSLFDAGDSSSEQAPAGASGSTGGGSLFDLGGDEPAEEKAPESKVAEPEEKAEPAPAKADDGFGGGSLFDLGGDEPAEEQAPEKVAEPKAKVETESAEPSTAADDAFAGGSLFDIGGDEPAEETAAAKTEEPTAKAAETEEPKATEPEGPKTEAAPAATGSTTANVPATEIPESGSLFDIASTETEVATSAPAPATEEKTEDASAKAAEPEAAEPAPAQEPQAAEPEAPKAEAPQAEAAPAATGSTTANVPATEIPESGSLFDIASTETEVATSAPAPATEEKTEDASAKAAEPEAAEPAPAQEPQAAEPEAKAAEPAEEPKAAEPEPKIRSLKEIKAAHAGESSPEPVAQPSPGDETPAEAEAIVAEDEQTDDGDAPKETEKPKQAPPADAGDAHQPRTDADIEGSGSLFDL
ncbi:hypothetical protein GCM10027425_04920 [Alteromonas gracilis]